MGKITNFGFQEEKEQMHVFRESYLETAEMMKQLREEEALLTEEEKQQKKLALEAECQKIMDMAESYEAEKRYVPDKSRVRLFNNLAESAKMIATECLLDVFTEITEKGQGIIRFRFEYMFLSEDVPLELRNLFATLIAASNDMHLGALSRAEYEKEYKELPYAEGEPLQITELCLYYDLCKK